MEEVAKNVKIIFTDFKGCPSIDMPAATYDRLVNEVFNNNAKRSIDFDEVAMRIRLYTHVRECDAFSDWWFNHRTAGYYWRKGEMSIHISEGFVSRWIRISGLVDRGDFDTELAKRQIKDLMNGPYGILTSIADEHCNLVHIKDVIFNDPATIVFWSDGTKTVCTCSEQDTYDPEKGLALCVMKKVLYNNKGHIFNNAREKWLKKGKINGIIGGKKR